MNTLDTLKKLISIKSLSGSEIQIQEYIYNYIKDFGLDPIWVGDNIALNIKGKNSKIALIFNAHVDTVGTGHLPSWKYNPYKGVIVGNKIYGLGVSDEKTSSAIFLNMISIYCKKTPNCDLWFMFVVKEELDGSGTKDLVDWFSKKHHKKYSKVAAVLAEPTGLKKIEIGHKGNIFIKVTSFGDSGHGSQPEKIKHNSIKTMYHLVDKLDKLARKWSIKYKNKFLGIPTISLTSIKGGDIKSPNKFADNCTAIFDVRTTPEVHYKAFEIIKEEAQYVDSQIKIEYLHPPAPFGIMGETEDIVTLFKKLTNAKLASSFGSNDMCFFSLYGIPAVVFGAGEVECIHRPNEFCKTDKIDKCIAIYKKAIIEFGKI